MKKKVSYTLESQRIQRNQIIFKLDKLKKLDKNTFLLNQNNIFNYINL